LRARIDKKVWHIDVGLGRPEGSSSL